MLCAVPNHEIMTRPRMLFRLEKWTFGSTHSRKTLKLRIWRIEEIPVAPEMIGGARASVIKMEMREEREKKKNKKLTMVLRKNVLFRTDRG